MGKAPPGRGRQWSIVNSRARPNADPFGVEGMGPLGGRDGLASGEPLRRWSRGVFSGRWDTAPWAVPYRTAAIPARGTRKARLARVNAFR